MYSVLLIDDEPRAIESLLYFVKWQQLGFQVCGTCDNGEDALELIMRTLPDIVVTDIQMPVMDGLELISRLQERMKTPPEIIVLSGYNEFSYARRALQLGVRHYLLKPILEDEVSEVLRRVYKSLEARLTIHLPIEAIREVRMLLEAIEALDRKKSVGLIDRMVEEIRDRPAAWTSTLINHLTLQSMKLIQQLVQYSDKFNIDQPMALIQEQGQGMKEALVLYVNQVIDFLQSAHERIQRSRLLDIDQFIVEHYRSNLSIKQVAAQFYLNPVYLGKTYHEKFGFGLLDRIHDLRIEEAQGLLRTTDLISKEVAEKVGYSQYNYFLKQFERRIGMKPMDYRASSKC
ncbi:MAG: response regulator [Candidatus Cohnella colombiensis]|uniref:Response regulator n=1 Tax=Candidatus Cohnella colombiensis TaxID=3121368 RepID=A0AA95JD47_9BACL|nr:MAG: response regulator [Cohnella sp.]